MSSSRSVSITVPVAVRVRFTAQDAGVIAILDIRGLAARQLFLKLVLTIAVEEGDATTPHAPATPGFLDSIVQLWIHLQ